MEPTMSDQKVDAGDADSPNTTGSARIAIGPDSPNQKKETARAALLVSILSMLISLGSFSFTGLTYWSQWVSHPSLIVNPSVSTEINADYHFAATVEASNIGNETIVIGDLGLMALIGTLSERPKCSDRGILTQIANQILNPSSRQEENHYLVATEVRTETSTTNTHAFAVSSNQVATRIFAFDISHLPWSGGAQLVSLCPVLKYMEPSGKITASICDGWELATVMFNGRVTLRILNHEPKPMTLLPHSNGTPCANIDL
jgi:hypothetical protein